MQFLRVCLGVGWLRLSRRHMSCGYDDSWVFALVFLLLPIPFIPFRRPPPSLRFPGSSLSPSTSYFICSYLSVWAFCAESLSGILAEVPSLVLPLGPLRFFFLWFLFDLARPSARVGLSGFRFHHYGSGSFFLSSYW